MATLYEVNLQSGRALSKIDFPENADVSIEAIGPDVVRLAVTGSSAAVEKALLGLKEAVLCYREIPTVAAGARLARMRRGPGSGP